MQIIRHDVSLSPIGHIMGIAATVPLLLSIAMGAPAYGEASAMPLDEADDLSEWVFEYERWRLDDGVATQGPAVSSARGSAAWWPTHRYGDLDVSLEFRIEGDAAAGPALQLRYRAQSVTDYHVVHIDARPDREAAVLMRARSASGSGPTRSGPAPNLQRDHWHTLRLVARGSTHEVYLDGELLATKEDAGMPGGVIGLWVDRVPVRFRNLRIEGDPEPLAEPFDVPRLPYVTVARDGGSADYPYAGFPSLVRSEQSGDLICVYYAGYKHVPSGPDDRLPRGGKIAMVRSSDDGQTWSQPQTIHDSDVDNHDARIAQLSDGRLVVTICSWPVRGTHRPFVIWSEDDGQTWSEGRELDQPFEATEVGWAPVVELPDGRLLLATYGTVRRSDERSSAVIRISEDGGETWPWREDRVLQSPEEEGHDRSVHEPEVVLLPDGRLLLIARQKMWRSESSDGGQTWSPLEAMPLRGDAPHLLLTSDNILLCAIRFRGGQTEGQIGKRGTCVIYSMDFGETWSDPVVIAPVIGGYVGMAELPDGRIFAAYYTESPVAPEGGEGSDVRGVYFRATLDGIVIGPEDQN